MSRSATASTSRNPLPSKSAWARGPPEQNSANTTPPSQSPAPPTPVSATNPASFHAAHSRRPGALGLGVSVKDGVNIPRNAVKQGSPVTFGSIGNAPAPISSPPACALTIKSGEGVKSFGSVAVARSAITGQPPSLVAPSMSSSQAAAALTSLHSPAPKFDKKSIAKLFQGPSTQSVLTHTPEAASPTSRSVPLPSQAGQAQPYQPPFASSAPRQGQNGNSTAPRTPIYSRPMANGQADSVGVSGWPQAGSGGPSAGPAPTALPSSSRKSIAKLFQGSSTQSVPTLTPEAASPASRSVPLPSQAGQAQPYQPPFTQPAMSQLPAQSPPLQYLTPHQPPRLETLEREYSPGSDLPPNSFPSNSDPAERARSLELGDSLTVTAYFFGVDADEPRIVQVTCTLEDPEEIGYLCHSPKFEEYVQWDKLGFVVVQRAPHSYTAPLPPHSLSLFFDDNGLINGQRPNRCIEKLVGGPGKAFHHWVGDFILFRDKGRDRFCDVSEEDLAPVISFFRDYRRIVFW